MCFADYDPSADPELYIVKVPLTNLFITYLVGSDIREQRIVLKDIEDF